MHVACIIPIVTFWGLFGSAIGHGNIFKFLVLKFLLINSKCIDRVRLKPPPKNFKQNYLTFFHKFPTTI